MSNISKIDKNFSVETKINKDDICFLNIDNAPFKIYGVFKENGKYRRLPEETAKKVSEGVYGLHTNTSGGRVAFVTDSSYVAIHAKMNSIGKMPHFALTGSAGFDLYADNEYVKTFVPPFTIEDGYESVIELGERKQRQIIINFPLYSGVNELYIGIQKDASLKEANPYKISKPFVYYGSSITQGGCASTPGMCYSAIISRRFNCDFVNLGFSGNARAEEEIAEYIKNLPMSLFVYDYDHNAPTIDHLEKTHERMFKTIRQAQPSLPIILMSRPKYKLTEEEMQRRDVIETTYKNALLSGDKNVYFIDGKKLTELCGNNGTVDGCHPTDYGFASMAEPLMDVIKSINISE